MKKLFLFFCLLAFFNGTCQLYAQNSRQDHSDQVTLEILDYTDDEYPVFRLKVTNHSEEVIYLLDDHWPMYSPNFFSFSLDPEYPKAMREMWETTYKDKDFFRHIEAGDASVFRYMMPESMYPSEKFKGESVKITFSYQFDPETDLEKTLTDYPVQNDWFDPDGPTRDKIAPFYQKLTPLSLSSQTLDFKVPRPGK